MAPTVYVLHFDPPYKHAKHYIGWVADGDAERRLATHTSPLVQAAKAAGCEITVAHTRPGDRNLERKLKNQNHSERYCPICKALASAPW